MSPEVLIAVKVYGQRVLTIIEEAFPEKGRDQITWEEVVHRIHVVAQRLKEVIPNKGDWGMTVTAMINAFRLDERLSFLKGVHYHGHIEEDPSVHPLHHIVAISMDF
mgnify:CR=1 FL=1